MCAHSQYKRNLLLLLLLILLFVTHHHRQKLKFSHIYFSTFKNTYIYVCVVFKKLKFIDYILQLV